MSVSVCVFDWCDRPATEADGLCFECAEEAAVLIADGFRAVADRLAADAPRRDPGSAP